MPLEAKNKRMRERVGDPENWATLTRVGPFCAPKRYLHGLSFAEAFCFEFITTLSSQNPGFRATSQAPALPRSYLNTVVLDL